MIAFICFVLAVLASPFKSKSRLEAENAVRRHQLIVLRPRVHLRINETRAYEVGPDSLRGQLCGNTRGQPDQSVFRSGVRGAGGKAEKRIYGSNVDDSTTAAGG